MLVWIQWNIDGGGSLDKFKIQNSRFNLYDFCYSICNLQK